MTKMIFILVSSVLILFACHESETPCGGFSLEASNIRDKEEYLILEAIMDEYYSNSDNQHILQKSHSIADSANFARYFKPEKLIFNEAKKAEYIALNSASSIWESSLIKKSDLISKDEFDCLLYTQGSWADYYTKYENSKAILKFGRPIQDNNRAIITYDHLCGYLCGYGYTVTLKKENNKWKVEKRFLIWIS